LLPASLASATIRVDQGTEFVSRDLDVWAYQRGLTLDFSRPGKPTYNAFIEAFNGRFREERLNVHWFLTLADAQEKWRIGASTTTKNGPWRDRQQTADFCCKTTTAQPAHHRGHRRKNLALGGPKFGLTATSGRTLKSFRRKISGAGQRETNQHKSDEDQVGVA
jgi:transposase InsO family protein